MNPKVVIGIDPGLSGGIAMTGLTEVVCTYSVMPVIKAKGGTELDGAAILNFFEVHRERFEICLVALEKVHAMPKQGVSSTFKFGMGFGEIQGIIKALRLPLELVTPQAWMKQVLHGTSRDKGQAIAYVKRRFPMINLKATPRCTKDHDGIADAICIAEWARQKITGSSA